MDEDYTESTTREEAMPAWAILKEKILVSYFSTKESLKLYRERGNAKDYADFMVNLVGLWDLTREYYQNDERLQTAYPLLPELDDCLFQDLRRSKKPTMWWAARYQDLDRMLFQIGLTRVTKSKTDDDLAGWEQ